MDREYDDRFIIIDDNLEESFAKKCSISTPHYVILSIDIGIVHLGISVTIVDKNYNLQEIVWINLINITEFDCKDGCTLYHTKTCADWLSHVFAKEWEFFDWADRILDEKQPPMGLVAIEQLIFYQFRNKAILIAPNSVHAHFGIGWADYEQRKVLSEKIGRKYLSKDFLQILYFYDRPHDITDSILFMLFWCHKQKEVQETKKLLKRQENALKKIVTGNFTMKEYFNAFRYVPPADKIKSYKMELCIIQHESNEL